MARTKRTSKKEEPKITNEELVDVVKDINEVLNLDPPIDEGLKNEEMIKEIKETVDEVMEQADVDDLTQDTLDTFEKLEINTDEIKKGEEETKPDPEPSKKDKKETTKKKVPIPRGGKKNQYGHQENTQAAFIDDEIDAKTKMGDLIKKLVKEFDLAEGKARARIKAHTAHLAKDHNVKYSTKE